LRLIFAGTPEFARVALEALVTAGHDVALVITQPDRPAGRGMRLQASPVKLFALQHKIPVVQPRSLRRDGNFPEDALQAGAAIAQANADAMVVAAYGLILPQWVLEVPRLGCLNIHASLLPRWRGAAPIHRALEAGDPVTGVTIMQMDAGLDTGDMLLAEKIPIESTDTGVTLHDKLANLGGRLIVRALEEASCDALVAVAQPTHGITYAHKVEKHEAMLDWSLPAAVLERRVRAFDPFPGALARIGEENVKIWQAQSLTGSALNHPPGEVLAVGPSGIDVATGEGVLRLTQLQRAGGRRLEAADFLRGFALLPGQILASG